MNNKFEEAKRVADKIRELKDVRIAMIVGSLMMLAMSVAVLYDAYSSSLDDRAFTFMLTSAIFFGAISAVLSVAFVVLGHSLSCSKETLAQVCHENHASLGFATPEMMIADAVRISDSEADPQRKKRLADVNRRKGLQSLYAKAVS